MKPARLTPPAANFGIAAQPSLAQFSATLTSSFFEPRACQDLRQQAQADAMAVAQAYHQELALPPSTTGQAGLLLTGHQPELFHPGVWVKNFALAQLARRHGLTPVNLIVDADLVKSPGLRVPDLREPPGQVSIEPFDSDVIGLPHETLVVRDRQRLARFPQRVLDRMAGVGGQPLLHAFWPRVMTALDPATGYVARAFVSARHQVEVEWGANNWELPLSRLCATPSFARFVGLLIARVAEFQHHHNAALAAFRRRHRLRSQVHPAPDLLAREGTWELPLWAWHADYPVRQRLFARPTPSAYELGYWAGGWHVLPVAWPSDADEQPAARAALAQAGWQIRSRALTTTLFARLFLGQAFIHGLGGGLYDEATDQIMANFFAVPPPPYLALTATLHLRATGIPEASARLRASVHRLWEGRWHAERFLDASQESVPLVKAKQAWLARQPLSGAERRERCRRLKEINGQLAQLAQPLRRHWEAELEQARSAAHFDSLCHDRDWSFVLHDADDLRRLMARVAKECLGETTACSSS